MTVYDGSEFRARAQIDWQMDDDTSRYQFDVAHEAVRQVVTALCNQLNIVVTSGRSEDFRPVTLEWLIANEIPFDALVMRKDRAQLERTWLHRRQGSGS